MTNTNPTTRRLSLTSTAIAVHQENLDRCERYTGSMKRSMAAKANRIREKIAFLKEIQG